MTGWFTDGDGTRHYDPGAQNPGQEGGEMDTQRPLRERVRDMLAEFDEYSEAFGCDEYADKIIAVVQGDTVTVFGVVDEFGVSEAAEFTTAAHAKQHIENELYAHDGTYYVARRQAGPWERVSGPHN